MFQENSGPAVDSYLHLIVRTRLKLLTNPKAKWQGEIFANGQDGTARSVTDQHRSKARTIMKHGKLLSCYKVRRPAASGIRKSVDDSYLWNRYSPEFTRNLYLSPRKKE